MPQPIQRDVETDQPHGPSGDILVRNNRSWGMDAFESEKCPQRGHRFRPVTHNGGSRRQVRVPLLTAFKIKYREEERSTVNRAMDN